MEASVTTRPPFRWLQLAGCLALPLGLGAIAGIVTSRNVSGWYASINKPAFNPPNSIFGPVWTALYVLMGIGCYLLVQAPEGHERRRALRLYGVQLALNFGWSFLFFGAKLPGPALAEILVLWAAIVVWMVAAWRVHRVAALLQIPYLLWVSFASVLNGAIWWLNR